MKRIITYHFLIFSLMFTSILSAQIKTQKGEPVKLSKKMAWVELEPLTSNPKGSYYLGIPYYAFYDGPVAGKRIFHIVRINAQHDFEENTSFQLIHDGEHLNYEFSFATGIRAFVFGSLLDKKEEKVTLFAQAFDLISMKAEGPLVQVSEVFYGKEYKRKDLSFSYQLSDDRTRLLIAALIMDDFRRIEYLTFDVFNDQLEHLKSWKKGLLYGQNIYTYDQLEIDDSGEVYLLATHYTDQKDYRNNDRNIDDKYVLSFTNDGIKTYAFPLSRGYFTSARLQVGKNRVIVSGFYSDDDDFIPEGAASVVVALADGEVVNRDQVPLGATFELPSGLDYKSQGLLGSTKLFKEFYFELSDFYPKADGGFYLVGERTVKSSKKQSTGGTTYATIEILHSDDLVVIDGDDSGNIKAIHKVEKYQETQDYQGGNYSGYYAFTGAEGISLLFNNLVWENYKLFKGMFSEVETNLVTVDPSGNQKSNLMFNSDGYSFRPNETQRVKDGRLLINGDIKRFEIQFIEVTY